LHLALVEEKTYVGAAFEEGAEALGDLAIGGGVTGKDRGSG
jgi:hypothetical protein